jgi:hypothetical protein
MVTALRSRARDTRRCAWLRAPDSASSRARRSGRSGQRPVSFACGEMADSASGVVGLMACGRGIWFSGSRQPGLGFWQRGYANAMQNTQSLGRYTRRSRERADVPAGFQFSGRLCSIWQVLGSSPISGASQLHGLWPSRTPQTRVEGVVVSSCSSGLAKIVQRTRNPVGRSVRIRNGRVSPLAATGRSHPHSASINRGPVLTAGGG